MSFKIGECLLSAFQSPNIYGILIAVLFTVAWLALYRPPMLKKPILWAFFISGALITLCAFCIIQNPLQALIGQAFYRTWGNQLVQNWVLLFILPGILITGLVQEGAKVLPGVIYWWKNKRTIDPKWGFTIGALSGAGWGFLEAQWVHNSVYSIGLNWDVIGTKGFFAIAPFVESFFTIPFHIASCALISYGIAKGRGWQFYLIVALIHAALQYSASLIRYTLTGLSDMPQLIIIVVIIAIFSLAISSVALLILWKRLKEDTTTKRTN